MLSLAQNNGIPSAAVIFDITILTCSVTGAQFIAKRDGISVNYARDRDGRIYSDAGVHAQIKQDIQARKTQALYISGRNVQGWKSSSIVGTVISSNVIYHNWATQIKHVTVRMFDGSLWYGRYAHLSGELCTLRPYKGQ